MAPHYLIPTTSVTLLLLLSLLVPGNAQAPVVQLDAVGAHSIRVRQAPPGGAIVQPPLQALMDDGPSPPSDPTAVRRDGPLSLANGNLLVVADPTTGLITATRASDGAVLLQQTALVWGAAAAGSRPNAVSAQVAFASHGASERIYGLGEHRTGVVNQMASSPGGFFKLLQYSQAYDESHGGDVSIPFYSSSAGFGFVWNVPSYGWVNISSSRHAWYSNATMNADFWITTTPGNPTVGRSPYADLLSHMADAVGHASPLPFFASGFIQCKDRYRNQYVT